MGAETEAKGLEDLLKAFPGVLEDANKKYLVRMERYGEAWRTRSFEDMHKHLRSEVSEFFDAKTKEEQYGEAVDIINVALILATRLRYQ